MYISWVRYGVGSDKGWEVIASSSCLLRPKKDIFNALQSQLLIRGVSCEIEGVLYIS